VAAPDPAPHLPIAPLRPLAPEHGRLGVVYALLAYTSWGVLPVYWKALAAVPPLEILMHRIVGTSLFAALLLSVARRWGDVVQVVRRRGALVALLASALLIAGNWGIFIWAVQRGQIVATSLGYYLNPLVNVALGTLFLRERLSRAQLLAVAIAGAGVAYFTVASGGLPWISLALALSFALYGLIRKTAPVGSLAGLAIETALLAPVAGAGILWRESDGVGALSNLERFDAIVPFLLLGAGPVTALPLLWFASAARRLRLVTIGLFQYIAPSLALVTAVFAYGEPFTRVHAITFTCIWGALALYSFESVRRFRAFAAPAVPPPAPRS
jgi:chloramphenicol-sensitive protein RarD